MLLVFSQLLLNSAMTGAILVNSIGTLHQSDRFYPRSDAGSSYQTKHSSAAWLGQTLRAASRHLRLTRKFVGI
jgi:hypothetical protein